MKKIPITEIILAGVLVVCVICFVLYQNSDSYIETEQPSLSENNLKETDTKNNAKPISYIGIFSVDKDVYFDNQIKSKNEMAKKISVEKLVNEKAYGDVITEEKVAKTEIIQPQDLKDYVDNVMELQHYVDKWKSEGYSGEFKLVAITLEVKNVSKKARYWMVYNDCFIMDSSGYAENVMPRVAVDSYSSYIQFCEMYYDDSTHKSEMIRVESKPDNPYNGASFIMDCEKIYSFRQVFAVPIELLESDNLVFGDIESVKGESIENRSYNNSGYRIFINR